MSSSHKQTNKRSSDSITIDLKKTPYGYELIQPKTGTTISLSKNVLAKTGKSSIAKDASKAGQKDATPLIQAGTKIPVIANKNKPISKPIPNIPTKISAPVQAAVYKEKPVVQEIEYKRREIFPFIGYTLPADADAAEARQTSFQSEINVAAEVNKADKIGENVLPQSGSKTEKKKKYPFIIPSSAHWFKFDEIHQLEKESLPEFFAGKPSKTPEIYKRYRNYIIELYRQNPKQYLNSTKCRQNLGGDACGIMRIHSFLEHWGLINFSVSPHQNPGLQPIKPEYITGKVFGFSKDEDRLDLFDQERKLGPKSSDSEKLFNQIRILTKKSRPFCDFCGMICGLVWFQQRTPQQYQADALATLPPHLTQQNGAPAATTAEGENPASVEGAEQKQEPQTFQIQTKKIKELILCNKCFTDGNIPNILSHSDFQKTNVLDKLGAKIEDVVADAWTEEDNVKLLELIQKHADDWEEVQKVFPKRSVEEIILHYLELPLNNVTSINLTEVFKEMDDEAGGGEKPQIKIANSFSEYSDPLLQHVLIFKSLLEKFEVGGKRTAVEAGSIKGSASKDAMEIEELAKEGKKSKGKNNKIEGDKIQEEEAEAEGRENFEEKINNICQFDDNYVERLGSLELESRNRAEQMRIHEEKKLNEYADLLVDLQITKLETKFTFLEEFERILWQERKNQEIHQKALIAERVSLAHQRLELRNQHIGHRAEETSDPTNMLNLSSNMKSMNVDDMLSLGNTDKMDFTNTYE